MMDTDLIEQPDILSDIDIEDENEIAMPPMYELCIFNDNRTPMDKVVILLTSVFNNSVPDAILLTERIHELPLIKNTSDSDATEYSDAYIVLGVYTKEVSEQKLREYAEFCMEYRVPLRIKAKEQS